MIGFSTTRMVTCPWITDNGICGASKETAHMQLWYSGSGGDFRSIHCIRCKHMSRATHWQCDHGIQWHKCLMHRDDPLEHRTTRVPNQVNAIPAKPVQLLPAQRPGPEPKKQKLSRAAASAANRKRIIQSAIVSFFSWTWPSAQD